MIGGQSTLLGAIDPPAIASDLASQGAAAFAMSHGSSPLLLVRVRDPGSSLARGLQSSDTPAENDVSVMAFKTEMYTPATRQWNFRAGTIGAHVLNEFADRCRVHILPIGKRGDVESAFASRISVGRATNKDLVLRDASVSKFHAWFELADDQVLVADAGSRNGTKVNEVALEPKKAVAVEPGTRIRFGAIEAMVCSARALWDAARG